MLSGSFVITGSALLEVTQVGAGSFANKLGEQARRFRVVKTPLQRDIDLVIRTLMLAAIFMGLLMLISAVLHGTPLMRSAQMAAVIAGVIPNGLFFMVIVAYALGALHIARSGALVQQANSVELLSNVTVLCMDKTGTLTANRIRFEQAVPLGDLAEDELKRRLADFARSASVTNKTADALINALEGTPQPRIDEVTFSSARKWSALAFDGPDLSGVYVLGALEMVRPHLTLAEDRRAPSTPRWKPGPRAGCACWSSPMTRPRAASTMRRTRRACRTASRRWACSASATSCGRKRARRWTASSRPGSRSR